MLLFMLSQAKHLSWSGNGHKVVTVDGIMLHKDDIVTGGVNGGMEERSCRWDDEIKELKRRKEGLELELEQLGSTREMRLQESKASGKVSGLEKKIYYAEIEKKSVIDRLKKLRREKESMQNEIGHIQPELEQLKRKIDAGAQEIVSREEKINDIVDRIFEKFSESVGVKNIREYEEQHLKAAQEMSDKRRSLHNQQSKLKSQLEYEHERDMDSGIVKLETVLSNLKEKLKEAKTKEVNVKSSTEKATKETDDYKEEVLAWKSKSEECERQLKELQKKISAEKTSISKHNRQIKSKEAQIEQLNSRKQEILEKCEMEQIALPIIADPMDTGDSSTSGPVFDFSKLRRTLQQNTRPAEREKRGVDFTQKIAELMSEIERTAPNVKALDQYKDLLKKEEIVAKEFEVARNEEKNVTDEFN